MSFHSFQDQEELFFVSIRDIPEGEPLKVWYSPYYALMMKKELLNQPQLQHELQPNQPLGEF